MSSRSHGRSTKLAPRASIPAELGPQSEWSWPEEKDLTQFLMGTARRRSRVGRRHQAVIPQLQTMAPPKAMLQRPSDRPCGQLLWSPKRLSTREVDKYLRSLQKLFADADRRRGFPLPRMCTERALYFLHQCDYNVSRAQQLLQPMPPEDNKVRTTTAALRWLAA